jgi:hypothetical protein
MAMTAAQKAFVRDATGDHRTDNASTPAYDLADATLDAIYDDATQGDSNLTRTIVWALRRRWARAINAVDLSGEFGNASHSQKQEQLKTLLDYWEGVALSEGVGDGLGIQSGGSAVTYTYRADSLQTEAPDYSSSSYTTTDD